VSFDNSCDWMWILNSFELFRTFLNFKLISSNFTAMVMAALPNIGGALCSTPQSLADAHYVCRAVTLPRRETRWNLQGCPKLVNRSQPLVQGRSSPYYQDMWRRYWCTASFFPIVDTCLSSEDIVRQSCAMVPRWRFFAIFLRPVFQPAACSTFQTCILNLR